MQTLNDRLLLLEKIGAVKYIGDKFFDIYREDIKCYPGWNDKLVVQFYTIWDTIDWKFKCSDFDYTMKWRIITMLMSMKSFLLVDIDSEEDKDISLWKDISDAIEFMLQT